MNTVHRVSKLIPERIPTSKKNTELFCRALKTVLDKKSAKITAKEKVKFRRYRNVVNKLIKSNKQVSLSNKQKIINQNGGGAFLSLLLPTVIALLARNANL